LIIYPEDGGSILSDHTQHCMLS